MKPDDRPPATEHASSRRDSAPSDEKDGRALRFFHRVTARPGTVVALFLLALSALAAGTLRLERDTRTEAFLPEGHSALERRDHLRRDFGLGDPIAVAVVAAPGETVYRAPTLELVHRITESMKQLDGIDPHRVVSLSTVDDIEGSEGGIDVRPLWRPGAATEGTPSDGELAELRRRVGRHRVLPGELVAEDGSATLVVAETLDDADGDAVYQSVLALTEALQPSAGESFHVAGESAISGFMSRYLQRDATRMVPLAVLVVALVLLVGFRSWRGVVLPQLVNAAALLAALATMALSGTPFYLITNGMLVLLIGIAVADAIHVLEQAREEEELDPDAGRRAHTVRALARMWRPILVTSVTDMAGFLALSAVAFMPPMIAFGWFAAIGIAAALVVSLLVLPNLILLLPGESVLRSRRSHRRQEGPLDGLLRRTGELVLRQRRSILAFSVVLAGLGLVQAADLRFDNESIDYFHPSEPIHRADQAINERFDGTHLLEVVLDSGRPEGVADAELLARVRRLQERLESQPAVRGSTSVVEVIEQVQGALQGDPWSPGLPASDEMVAQSLLLYSMGAGPSAFDGLLDGEWRKLTVRARLGSSRYTTARPVIEALRGDLARNFSDLEHHVTGPVELDYTWIHTLRSTHFRSLAVALVAVWLAAAISFRSLRLATLTTVPVLLAVLAVYAALGLTGRSLSVGTTMFAAIAIGTSIDFSVHLLAALRRRVAEGQSLERALPACLQTTGRALFLSGACLVLGFLILTVSLVPALQEFGLLVAAGSAAALASSLLTLPSLLLLLGPAALALPGVRSPREGRPPGRRESSVDLRPGRITP